MHGRRSQPLRGLREQLSMSGHKQQHIVMLLRGIKEPPRSTETSVKGWIQRSAVVRHKKQPWAKQPCWSYWQLWRWSSRSTSWRRRLATKLRRIPKATAVSIGAIVCDGKDDGSELRNFTIVSVALSWANLNYREVYDAHPMAVGSPKILKLGYFKSRHRECKFMKTWFGL